MKKTYTLSFFILLSLTIFGQEKTKKEISLDFYGFVRTAIYTDTYRGYDSNMDFFYLLPNLPQKNAGKDENGAPINKKFQSNISAASSRLGVKVNGPEILNAKTSAVLEFDFSGITTKYPSLFRIRKAYMKMDWEKSSLILGQTWHPFWGDAAFPHVGSLNTGAPFQPFNRSPQLRFDYKFTSSFSLSGAAIYENQYTSVGFYTISDDIDKTKALRYSGIPEMTLMAKYNIDSWTIGAGAEFKVILPIDTLDGVKTSETNKSYALTAYANYKKEKLYFLAKGVYGQNLTQLIMPGGYGVKSYEKGKYSYTNYNNYTAFVNATYGKKWLVGLFAAYGANLGTSDALYDIGGKKAKTAGKFLTMQSMYRIAPQIAYNEKALSISAEYELTSAEYGTGGFDLSDGLYDETENATNHRLIVSVTYKF